MERLTPAVVLRWYQQIRMAVLPPEYLVAHPRLTQMDFEYLLEEIVRLEMKNRERKRKEKE